MAKALKAWVREQRPGVAMMCTCNAVSNAPMLSINTRLGFLKRKEVGAYQIGRGTLAARLETRAS